MTTDTRLTVDYTRVSKDQTGIGGGVASQHEVNEQTAERKLGRPIDRTYSDNSISAHNGNRRPEFERLLADIAAGLIAVVIVWRVNRLYRPEPEEIGQVGEFIALCRRQKVRIIAKSGEYDLESADGRNAFLKDAVEAGADSDQRGENVALARKRQARTGRYGGGVRPFGWGLRTTEPQYQERADGKQELLRPVGTDKTGRPVWLDMGRHNKKEAAEIQKWADALLGGVPMAQVLRDLARRKVPTVAQTDGRKLRRNGKDVEHGGWNSRTIKQILTHPRTSGHAVYRGAIVQRNAFPPIIPDDKRQALITMFSNPARKNPAGNTPKWLGSLIYLCGRCNDGSTMRTRRNAQGVPVYTCNSKSHIAWPAVMVDDYIEKLIIARLSRDDVADLIPQPKINVDVNALRDEIAAAEQQKIEASLMFARRTIDGAQLEATTAELDKEIEANRAKIDAAVTESPLKIFAVSKDAARIWKGLSIGHKREILRLLPFNVILPPIGRGHRAYTDLLRIEEKEATPARKAIKRRTRKPRVKAAA
ncbi:recombinase family protein [Actinoallomurus sp. NPDC050550]|uniref:recombinase family protein n=1 Tax=Actinoallomurus sp. NPDC050550 TaxID=3154937 RepID=UPI0033C6C73E